jgi:chromosome segregation ATPase
MAERPEDRRQARPIVPDPDASLAPHRLRQPPPPRVWPLWCLLLLLLAAAAALGWAGWQERLRLQAELSRLGGEVSNVHARFDAEEGSGEALASLESDLEDLDEADSELRDRLEAERDGREARLAAMDERFDELVARIDNQAEEGETRQALLASLQQSLNALERAGEEGRAALGERLEALGDARNRDRERLEALEADDGSDDAAVADLAERQAVLEERLEEDEARLAERIDALADRQDGLAGELEDVLASRDDARERSDEQTDRLEALDGELGELRRGQIALSAQLEALQQ